MRARTLTVSVDNALEAAMETDISPLTHKMHSHMEDNGWGGCWRVQAVQGMWTTLIALAWSYSQHQHSDKWRKVEADAETAEARLSLLSSGRRKKLFFV